jgi:acyl carrier protein
VERPDVTPLKTPADLAWDNGAPPGVAPRRDRTAAEIEEWLLRYLAEELTKEGIKTELDVTVPFDRLGLSSATAVSMAGSLEEWLGREVDPTLPYDYPTIRRLSTHLAERLE